MLYAPHQYGHKRFLLIGLVIFSLFSLASALATELHQLAVFRAFQGLGAAAISPSLLGILAKSFAIGSKLRTEAFATFSAGSPLGSSMGLFAGGFHSNGPALRWRSVSVLSLLMSMTLALMFCQTYDVPDDSRPHFSQFFYFCLALSSFVTVLAFFIIPPDPPRAPDKNFKQVDWVGAVMAVIGLNMLVASPAISTHYTWLAPIVLAPFVASLLCLGGFLVWEYHVERNGPGLPLIRLSFFKDIRYAGVHCVAGLLWIGYADLNYFLNQ